MDNYTLSYSRQKKLEREETILDEEANKKLEEKYGALVR